MTSSTMDLPASKVQLNDGSSRRPKILEALGRRVTALASFVVNAARRLPLVGKHINHVEYTLSWLEPARPRLEDGGLYLLSRVDDQIYSLSDVAMARVPVTARFIPQLQGILSGKPLDTVLAALDRVRKRGVVGFTADAWVEYEPIVKNKSQYIYTLTSRVPWLHTLVSIFVDVSRPVAVLASDWLVMHSEIKDKHEILLLSRQNSRSSSSDVPCSSMSIGSQAADEFVDLKAGGDASDSPHQLTEGHSDADLVSSDGDEKKNAEVKDLSEKQKGAEVKDLSEKHKGSPRAAADEIGMFSELAVVHEEEEDRDDVADLFDMWGMGGNAIGPSGLETLRTHSSPKR